MGCFSFWFLHFFRPWLPPRNRREGSAFFFFLKVQVLLNVAHAGAGTSWTSYWAVGSSILGWIGASLFNYVDQEIFQILTYWTHLSLAHKNNLSIKIIQKKLGAWNSLYWRGIYVLTYKFKKISNSLLLGMRQIMKSNTLVIFPLCMFHIKMELEIV